MNVTLRFHPPASSPGTLRLVPIHDDNLSQSLTAIFRFRNPLPEGLFKFRQKLD